MAQLRSGLLEGRGVAVVAEAAPGVADALSALGARIELLPAGISDASDDDAGRWAQSRAPLHAVVFDAAASFGTGGVDGLTAAMEEAWAAVREVALGALIPADGPGKIVLVGPRPDAGPAADAARDGLESLARTLAVEWARHEVTAVLVAPGTSTSQAAVADLICFLCSPGAEYLSGCRVDLGAVSR